MSKRFPILPAHPERLCWGCARYCPSDSLAFGNGADRTSHPSELFGPDWDRWESGRPPDLPVDNGNPNPCLPPSHAT